MVISYLDFDKIFILETVSIPVIAVLNALQKGHIFMISINVQKGIEIYCSNVTVGIPHLSQHSCT